MLTGMDLEKIKDEIVKPYINDTIDADEFAPNNKLKVHGKFILTENGHFTFKKGVRYFISGCAAGGAGLNGVGGASGQWIISKQVEFAEDKEVSVTVGSGNTIVGDTLTLIAAYNGGFFGINVDGTVPGTTVFAGLPGLPGQTYINGALLGAMPGGGPGNGTPFGIGGAGGNAGRGTRYDYVSPTAGKVGTGYGTGGGACGCDTNYNSGLWGTANAPGTSGIVIIEW